MGTGRAARILLAGALAASALACRPRVPAPALPAEPAALLAEVTKAQDAVRSVSGQARVKVDGRGMDGSVDQFIAAEKPDRLHVEVLDFFGNVAAVLVADGERFALWDARDKVYYRGRPTPENVARLLPLAIDVPSLVTLLCGSAPLLDGAAPADVRRRDGTLELVLESDARRQVLAIGAGAAVERSRVRLAGGDAAITDAPAPGGFDLRFGLYRTWGGPRFPTEVALRAADPKVALDLAWRDVELNGALEPSLFRLEPPRGARVVELEAPGAGAHPW